MYKSVFISYASKQKTIAEELCSAIESSGLGCWIAPRDVEPGKSFSGQIVRAIEQCRALVLLYSREVNDSRHVLNEVSLATQKKKEILTVRIDNSSMTKDLEYYLRPYQWVDVDMTDKTEGFARVAEFVRKLCIRVGGRLTIDTFPDVAEELAKLPKMREEDMLAVLERVEVEIEDNKPTPLLESSQISSNLVRLQSECQALQFDLLRRGWHPVPDVQKMRQNAKTKIEELLDRISWYLDLNG